MASEYRKYIQVLSKIAEVATLALWKAYLGVDAHPAAVEGVLAEARGAAHLILAGCSVNDFQTRVSHCPVHTEVRGFPWLTGFCVADTCKKSDV